MNQQTIQQAVQLSGVGLHSGQSVQVSIKPAPVDNGVRFVRVDIPGRPQVRVCAQTTVMDSQVTRCTMVEESGVRVSTIEHLLAAAGGLGIDNLTVEINGQEVPGLDGSSRDFVSALRQAGIIEQDAPKRFIHIKKPLRVAHGDASVAIIPANFFKVSYTLKYNHPALGEQLFERLVTSEIFANEISPARTFCLEAEVPMIRSRGLGKGANEHNTLVIGEHGPLGNSLRFADECARHKALDIVGDLFLLGRPVRGHVVGVKSGHALNRQLVQKIVEHNAMNENVYDINAIMSILPHRYPFLFVDEVRIIEPGKRGIGIKNITINEAYFQGHFPGKPVMPGVIMVEAMAQTAGVVVLTSGAHPGKVALFMAIDGVKFRKVVIPGDQLVMEIDILRDREKTAQVKGVGKVNGDIVVEAEMMFSYTDASYLK